MKRLLLLVFLALPAAAQEEQLASVFDEANRLYLEQKYEAAAGKYESIVRNGWSSAEVYYNLGNAYYKLGRVQYAVLNYERAKRLAPNDEDLLVNLQLANQQLTDTVEAVPELFVYAWADALLTLFTLDAMVVMMYVLFLLTLGLFSLFLFTGTVEWKRRLLLSGMVCALLLFIGAANYAVQSYRENTTEFAVVMADVANIKSAPDKGGNDLFVIHRGLKVQVLDAVNTWRKIRLADGKVGWVPQQLIEII